MTHFVSSPTTAIGSPELLLTGLTDSDYSALNTCNGLKVHPGPFFSFFPPGTPLYILIYRVTWQYVNRQKGEKKKSYRKHFIWRGGWELNSFCHLSSYSNTSVSCQVINVSYCVCVCVSVCVSAGSKCWLLNQRKDEVGCRAIIKITQSGSQQRGTRHLITSKSSFTIVLYPVLQVKCSTYTCTHTLAESQADPHSIWYLIRRQLDVQFWLEYFHVIVV